MGYLELNRMEIEEVVRGWQVKESQRAIARATGLARETVKKYLSAAGDLGLSATGPPPTERDLGEITAAGGRGDAADHARGAAGGDARCPSGSNRHLDRRRPPAADARPGVTWSAAGRGGCEQGAFFHHQHARPSDQHLHCSSERCL